MTILLFLAALSASAGTPPQNGARAEQAKKDPNEVVCRRERVAGSLIPKRICHTRAQWTAMAEQAREENARFNNGVCSGGECAGLPPSGGG